MLPKAHVLYGFLLASAAWIAFPGITLFHSLLIFASSVLIDVDHYFWYINHKKDWSLKNAYYYLKEEYDGPKKQLMIFHTLECMGVIGMLSYFWTGFGFILLGILFHSGLDVFDMARNGHVAHREYSFINWIIRKCERKGI